MKAILEFVFDKPYLDKAFDKASISFLGEFEEYMQFRGFKKLSDQFFITDNDLDSILAEIRDLQHLSWFRESILAINYYELKEDLLAVDEREKMPPELKIHYDDIYGDLYDEYLSYDHDY